MKEFRSTTTWTEFEENARYHNKIKTTIKNIEFLGICGFWWSLGAVFSKDVGRSRTFSHSLAVLRFALHQKDISGSSRLPEATPRCISQTYNGPSGGGKKLLLEAKSLCDCERLRGLGASAWRCDGFLFSLVAAVFACWTLSNPGVLGSSGTRVV